MEKVELAKAILAVMKDVKGIDKSMQIGSGNNSYKGVPDQEVKKIIGASMVKNGLTMLPIDIEDETQVDRWEHTDQWGTKMKQSIFTKVKVKYLLLHESGESQELCGYGHGVDPQDKSAGKATTYALKYALLYTFLVPTGKIDDADNTHSDDIKPAPQKKREAVTKKAKLDKTRFENALKEIEGGNYNGKSMRATFELSKAQEKTLKDLETKIEADAKDK